MKPYSAKSTVSPTKKANKVKKVFNTTISGKRACSPERIEQPKNVNPEKLHVRRSIEDRQLARSLGLSLQEVGAL